MGGGRIDIALIFLRQLGVVLTGGLVVGNVLVAGSSSLLQGQLSSVKASDPVLVATVEILLAIVAMVSVLFPALAATRVDAAKVLRDQ